MRENDRVTPEHPLLKPMFEEAERRGLWFYAVYQQLWFSPKELRDAMDDGRFRWGATNWELRDPQEYVNTAERKVIAAQAELELIKARVYRGGRRA